MVYPSIQEIEDAIRRVEAVVAGSGNKSDRDYFNFHRERYLRMAKAVVALYPKGAFILNIGSHYLHTSLIFTFLGYEVDSMDVGVFWELDFIKQRAVEHPVSKIIEDDLESLNSLEALSDNYHVVLFAEILEHITFNPISFWQKIHRVTRSSGIIYISTPNSLNLYNVFRTVARVITFRGVGIPIGSIFSNVTYGHHWKEYSVSEIRKYFGSLSDDFQVKASYYHYRSSQYAGFYGTLMSVFSLLGNATYIFSDEIEAIVRVDKRGDWKIQPPDY
jgi:2-polyprenyl-3-methyl-5-hydroxy-6-metoxy-1,4-benzoquinol methylase